MNYTASNAGAALDLRRTKCPLNFVKAKLALEKKAPGETLEIWLLEDGESALNVPQSLQQEGHHVETAPHPEEAQTLCLRVTRNGSGG